MDESEGFGRKENTLKMNRPRRPPSSTYEQAPEQQNKGRQIKFLHKTSSLYRFFRCPSAFPSPFATNFAFLYNIQSRFSQNIIACKKVKAPLGPLRVGSGMVQGLSDKNQIFQFVRW